VFTANEESLRENGKQAEGQKKEKEWSVQETTRWCHRQGNPWGELVKVRFSGGSTRRVGKGGLKTVTQQKRVKSRYSSGYRNNRRRS